jgi:hypothetical protein
MAVILKLKCPDCAETFKWPGEQKWPDFCPLCRAQLATHSDEICMPFIRSSGTKATDKVYRDMEGGSEVRAGMAANMLGVSTADVSDLKITNLRDTHQGEMAHVPVVNDITRLMDANPRAPIGFNASANGAQYSGAVQTGPYASSGARMRTNLQKLHAQQFGHHLVSDRPGLETEQPGYRRRG